MGTLPEDICSLFVRRKLHKKAVGNATIYPMQGFCFSNGSAWNELASNGSFLACLVDTFHSYLENIDCAYRHCSVFVLSVARS